jgi:hypothetical protein
VTGLLAPAIFPALAFEHAHGLAGLGVQDLTHESWDRIATRAETSVWQLA